MWNETLIESMGGQNNGKRWLTVQLAAIIHAAIVGVLVAGSFWYVDKMSLPAAARIAPIFYEIMPGGPPPAQGVPQPRPTETPKVNKLAATPTPLVQEKLVPENTNNISDTTEIDVSEGEGSAALGVPEGVPGGDPNGTGQSGFGGPGANGLESVPIVEGPIIISREVQQPVLLYKVEPKYPELLRVTRREGTVVLRAVISRSGEVQDVAVQRSAHPLFDQASVDAVRNWKYRPAMLNGKAVSVYFTVTVKFTIK